MVEDLLDLQHLLQRLFDEGGESLVHVFADGTLLPDLGGDRWVGG